MRWRTFLLALSLISGLRAGDVIRVSMSEWTTLNPLLLAQDTDMEVVDLIFDRLVTLDARGEFIPELLESWTVLKGGREVVLKLRPGLTWQDGQPIEAEDLVFTWKALRLARVRQLADTAAGVTSLDNLTAEGPLTVHIRLKRPRGTLLSDLYNFIPVPRHRYQVGAKPTEAPENFAPIGSGPYRVVGQGTKTRVLLERWGGYRGVHPGLARSFELRDDMHEQAILTAFQEERLHYLPGIQENQLKYYLVRKGAQGTGVVRTLTAPQAAFSAYFLNCDSKLSLLGDPALRQVIAELVPWQYFARARRFFPTRLASGFWPPESWANDPTPRALPNPERAVSILDAGGWRPGADGIRQDVRGRRLVFVAYESAPNTNRSPSKLLAEQAARVGIRIEVRSLKGAGLFEKAGSHEGDLWAFGWSLALDPDVDSPLFTLEGYRTHANVSGYLNPEVDRLFDEGRHTLDPEARKKIYRQISTIIERDNPVIPITYNQSRLLVHRRLQGVTFNVLGQTYGFWPGRRSWRLGE
jgi:peptide/nickel transport system substrate-binding protein